LCGHHKEMNMIQITIIAAATLVFLILKRELPRREQPEPAGSYVRTTFPKGLQVAIVLLAGVVLFVFLDPPNLGAQPRPSQGQNAAQKKDAAVQAATPPDVVTVPDGTPLALELVESFSSSTAKVGDTVKFTTPYPARVNGLVVVPTGTAVSGSVAQVSHARRGARNGQVKVAIEKLILPSGELVTLRLRKSGSRKPQRMVDKGHQIGLRGLLWRAPFDPLTAVIAMPIAMAAKGDDLVYSAGTRVTVYFDGPLNLNRGALVKLQSPTYKGPAQVFFRYHQWGDGTYIELYCGQKLVESHLTTLRLELNPGTYSFSTDKKEKHAVRIEVQENHQYWIEREHGGLFVKDSQERLNKMEEIESDPSVRKSDFTPPSTEDSCPQVAQP
jgi:hypothetical protein